MAAHGQPNMPERLAWRPVAPDLDGFATFEMPEDWTQLQADTQMPSPDWVVASRLKPTLPTLRPEVWLGASGLLPYGGSVVQHTRQCKLGDRSTVDEAVAEPLMVEGEHAFSFTILRGSGTGMRIGVAADSGGCAWGLRVYDGKLQIYPPSEVPSSEPPVQLSELSLYDRSRTPTHPPPRSGPHAVRPTARPSRAPTPMPLWGRIATPPHAPCQSASSGERHSSPLTT